MARPIWTGSISFGLVNVPVKLFSAIESHKIQFHQFQRGTGERIRYKRVAEESGKEVAWDEIVKGYEVEKGHYVIVEPEELEALDPNRSRTIEIEEFVRLEEIDPIAWNNTYYLAPQEKVGAERPYLLLLRALQETRKVAIARFVMRTKQYLATIRPVGDILGLETMYFADEIRGVDAIDTLPVDARVSERELSIAEQLIDSLSTTWEPTRYRDTYRDRVLELIERKARGEEVVVHRVEEAQPQVIDLVKALRASLEATKEKKTAGAEVMLASAEEEQAPAAKRPRGNGHSRGNGDGRAKGDGSSGLKRRRRGGNGSLETLSKAELQRRASEADIPGRSKMNKQQLISALEGAA